MLTSLLLLSMSASPVPPNCDRPKSNVERAECLGTELKGADATINRIYTELSRSLQADDRTVLRKEQLGWIASRDRTCRIRSTETNRDAWFAALLRDPERTVCVVRLTNERVERLNAYKRGEPIADASAGEAQVYEVTSPTHHLRGKFYFEITVDHAAVLTRGEAALFAGVMPVADQAAIDASGSGAGTLITVRKADAAERVSPSVYGFALDLDNGRVYISHDGAWDGGAPGSAGGVEIMRGREHFGEITSSVALNQLLKSKAISINWGLTPFAKAMPLGYRPLESK